jgi:hypothetical protein
MLFLPTNPIVNISLLTAKAMGKINKSMVLKKKTNNTSKQRKSEERKKQKPTSKTNGKNGH